MQLWLKFFRLDADEAENLMRNVQSRTKDAIKNKLNSMNEQIFAIEQMSSNIEEDFKNTKLVS